MHSCIYIYSKPEQLLIPMTYLTRKLSSKGPEVLENSWSRTLRSNWSQLFWPLNNKWQVRIICLLSNLYIQPKTLHQKRNNTKKCIELHDGHNCLTYVSSMKHRPKYSFSFRIKWEATKSNRSRDNSFGWKRKYEVIQMKPFFCWSPTFNLWYLLWQSASLSVDGKA